MTAYFITGTDTEVGKTFCTAALLYAFRATGKTAIGFKPIASGTEADGYNSDVLALQAASLPTLPYKQHNLYTFQEATAPHLAAMDTACPIQLAQLSHGFHALQTQADVILTEGAGGWLTPLNEHDTFADWVIRQRLPVIMVVGMKLGCINHALLTTQAITQAGLPLAGWIANCISPQPHRLADYFHTLQYRIAAPCLGMMPYLPHTLAQQAANHLTISGLE